MDEGQQPRKPHACNYCGTARFTEEMVVVNGYHYCDEVCAERDREEEPG